MPLSIIKMNNRSVINYIILLKMGLYFLFLKSFNHTNYTLVPKIYAVKDSYSFNTYFQFIQVVDSTKKTSRCI